MLVYRDRPNCECYIRLIRKCEKYSTKHSLPFSITLLQGGFLKQPQILELIRASFHSEISALIFCLCLSFCRCHFPANTSDACHQQRSRAVSSQSVLMWLPPRCSRCLYD